jgi:hypothetical protein
MWLWPTRHVETALMIEITHYLVDVMVVKGIGKAIEHCE